MPRRKQRVYVCEPMLKDLTLAERRATARKYVGHIVSAEQAAAAASTNAYQSAHGRLPKFASSLVLGGQERKQG